MFFLAAFISGVALASLFQVHFLIVSIFLFLSIIVIAIFGYQKTFSSKALILGTALLFLTIGIIRFNQFNFNLSMLTAFTSTRSNLSIKGYVISEQKINDSSSQFIFRVKELEISGKTFELDEKILIKTASHPRYRIGDILLVEGEIKIPQNIENSEFNYVAYLKHQGIQTEMFYPQIMEVDSLKIGFIDDLKLKFLGSVHSLKNGFQSSINRSLPEPNASYLNGILLGTRQNIPDDLKEAFSKTSMAHVLAISGYNITILAEAILLMLVYFVRRRKAFWISVLIIFIFTIMAGASASVVRAAIMGLLLLFAQSFGRLNDIKNAILLAAAVMIYFNPFVLRFDIGFQLSFLALIGLVYVYPIFKQRFKRIPAFGNLKDVFFQSLSAQIMVIPLIVFYFKSFSLVSLPANLLVLPFMPFVMLLGFLTGILGMVFAPLGQFVGYFAWALSQYQIKVIQFFASFQFSAVTFGIPIVVMIGLYILILVLLRKYHIQLTQQEIKI